MRPGWRPGLWLNCTQEFADLVTHSTGFFCRSNLFFLLENDTLIMWKLHATNSAGSFCGNGLLCSASSLLVSRRWAKNAQLGSKAADVSRLYATFVCSGETAILWRL